MAINAGTVYSDLVLRMDQYERNLRNAERQMNDFSSRMESAGKKMQNVGKKMTTAITLPIAGVAAAATKMGMDFESGMSEVQAISGATAEDLQVLEDRARELAKETKFSATEAADALKYMSLAGWNTKQMYEGLPAVLDLAAAANMDLARASDIVTDTMSAFQMQAEESNKTSDIFAQTQAKSNTNVEQLGEAMKYAGAAANSANMDLEETNTILGILADSGIKGSMAGTTFTAMLRDMKKNADDGNLAVGDMSVALYDAEGNMRDMGNIIAEITKATEDMTTAQRDATLSNLFGEQALKGMNILLATGTDRYNELENAIRNSDGASKDMSKTMMDNMKGSWESIKSTLGEAALQIYEVLLPSLESLADKVATAADWFTNLDESTRETIIKMTGLAAAVGPVLLVGGKLAGSIKTITSLFGMFSGATATAAGAGGLGALGTGLTTTLTAVAPWAAAIAGAGLAAYGLYKNLSEDAIPAVDLFGDEVSENTQQAVGGFLELEEKATLALNQLSWSGQTVTEEMTNNIIVTFDEMGNQILSSMKSDHQEQLVTMQNFFGERSALTEEEEAEILASMEKNQQEQANQIQIGQERIKEILNTAKEEKRELKEEERTEINRIQQAMTEKAVEYMSESEREQKVILERLKTESSTITAQQAAEVVRNSLTQKEQTIANAEEQYNRVVAEIIKQRDETGTISGEQAQKLMQDAKMQYEEVKSNAQKMHQDVVSEAKQQAQEHVNEVNWSTGEIKSKWQAMTEEVKSGAIRFKEDMTQTIKELGADIKNEWSNLVEETKQKWNDVKTSVSKNIDSVKSKISEGIDRIKEWNSTNVKEKVFSIVEKVKKTFSSIGDKVSGAVGNNARGTNYWRGGLTWVGEEGPEIIDLPRGSKVYSNPKSEQIASQGRNITQNITINSPTPLSPSEVARKNLQASRQLAMEWGV